MKLIKYQKARSNEYKLVTDKGEFKLYDDIIIKYELLLKKVISDKEFDKVLEENNLLKAYYDALKAISVKLRCEKEVREILKKKNYNKNEIDYAINRLSNDGYLKKDVYIEAFIHDMLSLYVVGEDKILSDLIKLGFKEVEIKVFLDKIDSQVYLDKIEKYILKKAKANRKSVNEFKKKMYTELSNKGFKRSDIIFILDNIDMEDNSEEVKRLIDKLYQRYIKKYDEMTTRLKIKNYLYQKGYKNIDSLMD